MIRKLYAISLAVVLTALSCLGTSAPRANAAFGAPARAYATQNAGGTIHERITTHGQPGQNAAIGSLLDNLRKRHAAGERDDDARIVFPPSRITLPRVPQAQRTTVQHRYADAPGEWIAYHIARPHKTNPQWTGARFRQPVSGFTLCPRPPPRRLHELAPNSR